MNERDGATIFGYYVKNPKAYGVVAVSYTHLIQQNICEVLRMRGMKKTGNSIMTREKKSQELLPKELM